MSKNINHKIAIVLLNLGGPDKLSSVRPFLFNLFNDKFIIRLPKILRYIVAFIISTSRYKSSKINYSMIGGKSTLLEETTIQKQYIEKYLIENNLLDFDFKIFISMRYWYPTSQQVVTNIKSYDPKEIILLPLYPQFSTTTTQSSILDFKHSLAKEKLFNIPIKSVCCYYNDDDFISAHINLIKQSILKISNNKSYKIIFSAHSLPLSTVKSGDPYQWQIEQTVEEIVKRLKINKLKFKIAYQSKIGPIEWLSPSTEDEIINTNKSGENIILVPISFVSEHIETLVELDIEYKLLVKNSDLLYIRVPTLRIDKYFIKSLANLIKKLVVIPGDFITSNKLCRQCPKDFKFCLYKN
ncbi:ferrochelatase [Rickettsia endosymbiont of Cardiosporidium cionae]|uniref:ferrochelatase n=1 Tax=Rickettsia endosymbiont of Cardiosporidium cionae TaxID=2777155 RepID=UPI0018959F7D|nr:ferrochelatase [Rickettsia endosymbiont of Cardiosporidium cionae]KAF8818348.1 ferrochelatase [Rickettsia endosymbiont of Cardiosporidium cionae]